MEKQPEIAVHNQVENNSRNTNKYLVVVLFGFVNLDDEMKGCINDRGHICESNYSSGGSSRMPGSEICGCNMLYAAALYL